LAHGRPPILWIIAMFAPACAKHGPPANPFESDYARFTEVKCTGLRRCTPWSIDAPYRTDGECPSDQNVRFHRTHPNIAAQLTGGRIGYDAAMLTACAGAYAETSCDRFLEAVDDPQGPCAQAIRGLRTEGQGCFDSFECEVGLFCARDTGACGICTRPAQIGEPCDGRLCASDSRCIRPTSTATAVCTAKRSLGAACDLSDPNLPTCTPPLVCVGPNGSKVCTARGVEGAVCPMLPPDASRYPPCDDTLGLVCVNGGCTKLGYAAEGEVCGDRVVCRGFLSCDPTTGVCTTPPMPGEACTFDQRCIEDAFCDITVQPPVCRALLLDGIGCRTSDQCEPPRVCLDATSRCGLASYSSCN
jgi:hypothetical protein